MVADVCGVVQFVRRVREEDRTFSVGQDVVIDGCVTIQMPERGQFEVSGQWTVRGIFKHHKTGETMLVFQLAKNHAMIAVPARFCK